MRALTLEAAPRILAGTRVLVLGEAILDSYVTGESHRLCQEGPAPVVDVSERTAHPGGAANTAHNAAQLGGDVRLLSLVGDDDVWHELSRLLDAVGVCTEPVLVSPLRRTLQKQRIMSDGHVLARLDFGSTEAPSRADADRMARTLRSEWERADAVLVSDYAYGAIPERMVTTLATLQAKDPKALVCDARDLSRFSAARPLAVKPNYREACTLLGIDPVSGPQRVEHAEEWGAELLDLTGAELVALTSDRDGTLVFATEGTRTFVPAEPSSNTLANGAGDTFLAALGLSLAAGYDPAQASTIAMAAASVVVSRPGTAACSSEDLASVLGADRKCGSLEVVRGRREAYRRQGKRVVFANGCFDVLHAGHVGLLEKAASLGDVLIVAVNSDESVARLKGPARPVNRLQDRMRVLAALRCVDHVLAFSEDTPERVIETLRPDVIVKGGDYRREDLPEADIVAAYGGDVVLLPLLAGHSTTSVIERIRAGHPKVPVAVGARGSREAGGA